MPSPHGKCHGQQTTDRCDPLSAVPAKFVNFLQACVNEDWSLTVVQKRLCWAAQ